MLNGRVQTENKPASSRFARLSAEAEALAGLLTAAEALVGGGRRLDVAGLDLRVGRLCAQCLDLEPPEGRALRPGLAALRSQLDRLFAHMRQPS